MANSSFGEEWVHLSQLVGRERTRNIMVGHKLRTLPTLVTNIRDLIKEHYYLSLAIWFQTVNNTCNDQSCPHSNNFCLVYSFQLQRTIFHIINFSTYLSHCTMFMPKEVMMLGEWNMNEYIRLCRCEQEKWWYDGPQIYTMPTHVSHDIHIKRITSNE